MANIDRIRPNKLLSPQEVVAFSLQEPTYLLSKMDGTIAVVPESELKELIHNWYGDRDASRPGVAEVQFPDELEPRIILFHDAIKIIP